MFSRIDSTTKSKTDSQCKELTNVPNYKEYTLIKKFNCHNQFEDFLFKKFSHTKIVKNNLSPNCSIDNCNEFSSLNKIRQNRGINHCIKNKINNMLINDCDLTSNFDKDQFLMAVNNLIDQLSCLDINLAMITSSQRGHPQLCLNGGFFLRISSQTENKVNWRCIENYCKAKCNTEGSTIGEEYSVNFNEAKDREHNHAPKHIRFEIKEKRLLAFVPPSDVKFLFSKLKSELDSSLEYYDLIIQLFKYMEENWIGFETLEKKGRGKGVRLETKTHKPRYEIELWNIHTRINDCLPRTNNYVEAWHKAFSSMLVTHPLVYSLVDKLREE
ncbi:unnamed protein product, partial [Brachionus calyciflorus]